jgi:predicted nuclease of predicted toxin-antitoxin system
MKFLVDAHLPRRLVYLLRDVLQEKLKRCQNVVKLRKSA